MEFTDEAFYAVLGRDLATTGSETNTGPSGFAELPGQPPQVWYHWGELWLAAAVITITGSTPLAARYLVVLPVLLLAAAALGGTVVRRLAGTRSRRAYLLGVLACLFLAPVPLVPGPFFSSWAAGLVYGISLYGLAAVAVLLALYGVAVLGDRPPSWPLAIFAGSAAALLLPAHIVIALLALVGVGVVGTLRIARSLRATQRLPVLSPVWQRTILATAIALGATVAWGELTGHGLGGGGGLPSSLAPFNAAWRGSVAIVLLGAGVFLAIPLAWFLERRTAPLRADLYLGTLVLLLVGAIAWGARLADFNMFYFFFDPIAVIATPLAAVAVWTLVERLQECSPPAAGARGGRAVRAAIGAGCALSGSSVSQQFGPRDDYPPIPVTLLTAIEQLPPAPSWPMPASRSRKSPS